MLHKEFFHLFYKTIVAQGTGQGIMVYHLLYLLFVFQVQIAKSHHDDGNDQNKENSQGQQERPNLIDNVTCSLFIQSSVGIIQNNGLLFGLRYVVYSFIQAPYQFSSFYRVKGPGAEIHGKHGCSLNGKVRI